MACVYTCPRWEVLGIWKSFVLIILFIVLPHFAVFSRLLGKGIFLKHFTKGFAALASYLCIECVHWHCSLFPSPSEKVGFIWPNPCTVL